MKLAAVSREFTIYSRAWWGKGILEAHGQSYVRNKIVGCLHCEEGWWPIDLSGDDTFGHR